VFNSTFTSRSSKLPQEQCRHREQRRRFPRVAPRATIQSIETQPERKEDETITETEKTASPVALTDRDAQWKDIASDFFDDLLAAALPELAEEMNPEKKPEFQEQELREIATVAGGKKRRIDLLAKVCLKSGRDIHVLLHIEIQDDDDDDFPERMFRYHSLLMARYLKSYEDKDKVVLVNDKAEEIISLAILTAPRPRREKDFYERSSFRNRLRFDYPVVKVWEGDPEEMAASANPFHWVILAGRRALESGGNDRKKLRYLRELNGILKEKQWPQRKKERLFLFMEAILRPGGEEAVKEYRKYLEEVKTKEGEKMVYVSVPEEMGIEKGTDRTKRDNALRMLRRNLDIGLVAECVDLPEEEVRRLAEKELN